ncbi:uncharacterized protein WM294_010412 [Sarcoramphus papa]
MVLTAWACLSSAFRLFQVSLLQTQLARERKCKQDYIECCAKTSQELSDLHRELSCSLAAVVREPEAAVLEAETQKLDRSLSLNLAVISLDSQSPEKQPLHSTARSARSDDLSLNRTSDLLCLNGRISAKPKNQGSWM